MSPYDRESHPLRDKNVLVTGATGFTGTHLVRKLVDFGARVTAIARESSNIKSLEENSQNGKTDVPPSYDSFPIS